MTEINTATATMMENEFPEKNNTTKEASTRQYEMTEQLSAKMHITMDEAKAALEAADWNMLTTTHILEQEAFRRKQALDEVVAATSSSTQDTTENATVDEQSSIDSKGIFKNLGRAAMNLIRCGNRHRFVVQRGDEQLLDMPVTVMALLLLGSFGTCALLMVVGLFAGCRYTLRESNLAAEA